MLVLEPRRYRPHEQCLPTCSISLLITNHFLCRLRQVKDRTSSGTELKCVQSQWIGLFENIHGSEKSCHCKSLEFQMLRGGEKIGVVSSIQLLSVHNRKHYMDGM